MMPDWDPLHLGAGQWKSVYMHLRVAKAVAIVGPLALVALFASGMVLAASWLIAFPEAVLVAAWLVALAAMVTVVAAAGLASRRMGHGPVRAVRHMFGDLGRFVLYFF